MKAEEILYLVLPILLVAAGILLLFVTQCRDETAKWLIALGVSIAGFQVGYIYGLYKSRKR